MTRQLPNRAIYAPEPGPSLKGMASVSILIDDCIDSAGYVVARRWRWKCC